MSRKPARRKLRAAYSSVFSNVASGTVMVPGNRMCCVGGSTLALGNIGDHRRHQRIAQGARDLFRQCLCPDVVLAQRHPWAVLLGAADRHDDRRLAGGDAVAKLGPGQIVDEDAGRLRLGDRTGGGERAGAQRNAEEGGDHRRILWDRPGASQAPSSGSPAGESMRSAII